MTKPRMQFGMQFGIDLLLQDASIRKPYVGKKIALVAHPASVNHELVHSMDSLQACSDIQLVGAFGPQHGMRGEKQYNMIESDDYVDPVHSIPVWSLYGKNRRPDPSTLKDCDGVMIDLQDVGCRIYTYLTTMVYMIEACAKLGKFVCVLDRPNPAGRSVEGSILKPGNESFVGVGEIIMRHGMTLGEMAKWWVQEHSIDVDLRVVSMQGYDPNAAPGYGWPLYERAWVNPSPNIPTHSGTRCYPGTVMLEGTHLSEGRGTTRPLEGFGAPDLDGTEILKVMQSLAPEWLKGCALRPFYFQPTFYKYQDQLCSGIQIHTDGDHYDPAQFRPYRLMALAFKAIRQLHPKYPLWRNFPYEYVDDRLAIDVITGCDTLRTWVDDSEASVADLEKFLSQDESRWTAEVWNQNKIYD